MQERSFTWRHRTHQGDETTRDGGLFWSGIVEPMEDDFYKIPIYEHASVNEFSPTDEIAAHRIHWEGGVIHCAAAIRDHPVLTVGYHGAVAKQRLPLYERLASRRESPESFLLFADPTLDLSTELNIGWCIGHADSDPTDTFLAIVRKVADACGSNDVQFTGSSAGGFAALQHSIRWPGSTAIVFAPQTDVSKYYASHYGRLIQHAFPGLTGEEAHEKYLERFSAVHTYATMPRHNKVRYVMNQGDDHHLNVHCKNFAEVFGLEPSGGVSEDGTIEIVPIDMGEGHKYPKPEVFEPQLNAVTKR